MSLNLGLNLGVFRSSTPASRSRALTSLAETARSSSRPHHLRLPYSCRPYSSPSSPSNNNKKYKAHSQDRSQFKILPFLAIFAIGSGSYVLLVKSRTGVTKPPANSQ